MCITQACYNEEEEDAFEFDVLLRRCFFKLLIDFKVKIVNLPRIRNQLQLIEFLKLVVFMSKFDGSNKINFSPRFDSVDCQNFEGFCLTFLNKFVFNEPELVPLFHKDNVSSLASQDEKKASGKTPTQKSTSNKCAKKSAQDNKTASIGLMAPDELENLIELLIQMCHLAEVVFLSDVYTCKFRLNMYTLLMTYLNGLISHVSRANDSSETKTRSTLINARLHDVKAKIENYNPEKLTFTLKNLCRIRINECLTNRKHGATKCSALSKQYVYFKLPACYTKIINFLTFDLVQDLYGDDFDLNKFRRDDVA